MLHALALLLLKVVEVSVAAEVVKHRQQEEAQPATTADGAGGLCWMCWN